MCSRSAHRSRRHGEPGERRNERGRPLLATRRRALLLAGLLGSALFISHTGLVANAPPPLYLNSRTPILREARLEGVRVEITEEGDVVRLVLPRARFAELAGALEVK